MIFVTIVTSILDLLKKFAYTICIPFNLIYYLLSILYKIFFSLQIFLTEICIGLFDYGYGCKVIDPSYVFTNVIWYTVIYSVLFYIAIEIKNIYFAYKKTIKKSIQNKKK